MSVFRASVAAMLLAVVAPCHAHEDLAAAQLQFDEFRYAEGAVALQRAAEAGNRDARMRLGLMFLYGHRLYGDQIAVQTEPALRWLRLAAADGCEVSTHVLARRDARPLARSVAVQ